MTSNWAAILRKKNVGCVAQEWSFWCCTVDTLFYSIFKNLRLVLFIATVYFGNIKYQYEASVDKGRAIGVIYQDFCKAFDVSPPASFSLNWGEMDLMGGPRWIRNCLDSSIQRVMVIGSESQRYQWQMVSLYLMSSSVYSESCPCLQQREWN